MDYNAIKENDILVYNLEGEDIRERVNCIRPLDNLIVLMNIDKGFKALRKDKWDRVCTLVADGKIKIASEDPYDRSIEWIQVKSQINKLKKYEIGVAEQQGEDVAHSHKVQLYEKRKAQKKWRQEIVSYIVSPDKEPGCYFEDRVQLIKQAAELYGEPKTTVRRWLEIYLKGGKRANVLIDNFMDMGKGIRKKDGKKLGRKGHIDLVTGTETGVNLTEEVEQYFNVAIKLKYTKIPNATLMDAYEWMLETFYLEESRKSKEGVRQPGKYPTEAMFYRWHRETELNKQLEEKIGKKKYAKDYRGLNADAMSEVLGPGHVVEIDATIGDVWLRSSINPEEIVGRPVVYVAKDVYSRMIVGLHVCLEGPSYIGAMSLLYNMQMDKIDYCKQYGVNITADEWPVEGVPQMIKADRGELISPRLKDTIENLGVIVDNTGSYRGDEKGIVERTFRILNDTTIKFLPGHIKKDYRERGARNYQLDAQLDIIAFTRIMILTVLELNITVIEGYERTQDMIDAHVRAHPDEIWVWGQKSVMRQRKVKPNELIASFMPHPKSASITLRGMEVDDLIYTTDMPRFQELKAQARREGRKKANVCIDHRNVDKIYWIPDKSDTIIPLYLAEGYEAGRVARGHTWEEVKMHHFTEKVDRKLQKEEGRSKKKAFRDKRKQEIKTVVKRNKGIKVVKGNVRASRAANSEMLREAQAIPNMIDGAKEINLQEQTTRNDYDRSKNDEIKVQTVVTSKQEETTETPKCLSWDELIQQKMKEKMHG